MTNNKAREVNNPIIKQLINETSPEELAKIDAEMTNNKQQTAVGIGIATYDNVEWVFQFNDDNPILISQPIGGEKELIIKLDNTSYSNIVFSDGKGNTFKIFAREQTQ
jgi:hypothetical protein